MQICNSCETAPRSPQTYFPSGRIRPRRADCDKQSESFITELSAAVHLHRGRPGRRAAGSVFFPPWCTRHRGDLGLQTIPELMLGSLCVPGLLRSAGSNIINTTLCNGSRECVFLIFCSLSCRHTLADAAPKCQTSNFLRILKCQGVNITLNAAC